MPKTGDISLTSKYGNVELVVSGTTIMYLARTKSGKNLGTFKYVNSAKDALRAPSNPDQFPSGYRRPDVKWKSTGILSMATTPAENIARALKSQREPSQADRKKANPEAEDKASKRARELTNKLFGKSGAEMAPEAFKALYDELQKIKKSFPGLRFSMAKSGGRLQFSVKSADIELLSKFAAKLKQIDGVKVGVFQNNNATGMRSVIVNWTTPENRKAILDTAKSMRVAEAFSFAKSPPKRFEPKKYSKAELEAMDVSKLSGIAAVWGVTNYSGTLDKQQLIERILKKYAADKAISMSRGARNARDRRGLFDGLSLALTTEAEVKRARKRLKEIETEMAQLRIKLDGKNTGSNLPNQMKYNKLKVERGNLSRQLEAWDSGSGFSHTTLFLSGHAQDVDEVSPLVFDKELIYVGRFEKGAQKFNITEDMLDNWIYEFEQMAGHGFKIKLPVEHTFDPEKNRGHVTSLSKRLNSRGMMALFGRTEFNDAEAAKLARSTDVSVYSPPEYKLGNGYKAVRPITHVALTDYPVIPGLGAFEVLAASFSEGPDMTMQELAEALGIDTADAADDAEIGQLIIDAFEALQPDGSEDEPVDDVEMAFENDDNDAVMLSLVTENRIGKIDLLVSNAKLSPAEAREWKNTYSPDSFALSQTDGFDAAYRLAQNRPALFTPGSKTGPQYSTLDPGTNPIIADALARQKAGAS